MASSNFNNKPNSGRYYVGAHVSFNKNIPEKTTQELRSIAADAAAFFLKPKLLLTSSTYSIATRNAFKNSIRAIIPNSFFLMPHSGYTINLANPDQTVYKNGLLGLQNELLLAESLGADIVLHPGSAIDHNAGINQIVAAINEVGVNYNSRIILETMSGSATAGKCVNMIGSCFADIAAIINGLEDKTKVGVCIDTCHLFVSGYDIRTDAGFNNVMNEFDAVIGIKYLRAVHVNDSTFEFNCGRDKHAAIGTGLIGLGAFKWMMNDARFTDIPLILERSGTTMQIRNEIELLKSLTRGI